jgi:hypothetical protein
MWGTAGAVVCLWLALAFIVGHPIGRRVMAQPGAWPLSTLLGAGVLQGIAASLALCGLLRPIPIVAAILVAATAALRLAPPTVVVRRPLPTELVIPPLAVISVLTLAPPASFDDTLYHLPMGVHAADTGRVAGSSDFLRYSFLPQAAQTLYGAFFALGAGVTTVHMLQFAQVVLGAVLIANAVALLSGSAAAGLVALTPLVGTAMLWRVGTTAFVDGAAFAYVAATGVIAAGIASGKLRADGWSAAATGVLAASAATTKVQAGLTCAALLSVLALVARREIRAAHLGIAAAVALILAGPWFVRTTVITGNPIYPLATSLFGNRGPWSDAEVRYQFAAAESFAEVRAGSTIARLLTDLGLRNLQLGAESPLFVGHALSPIALLGAAAVLTPLRRNRGLIVVGGAGAVLIAVRLAVDMTPRYLLYALGLLALATGLGWAAIFARRPAGSAVTAAAAAALLVASIPTIHYVDRRRQAGLPTAAEDREAYVRARIPCFEAVAALNRSARPYRAYGAFCEEVRYYADHLVIGDWFGPGSYYRVLGLPSLGGAAQPPDVRRIFSARATPGDVAAVRGRLRRLGVDHLVVAADAGPAGALDAPGSGLTLRCACGEARVYAVE